MIYEKFEGNTVSVNIENIDDKDPYTVIGTKAFLSCKNVYEVKLPYTVCEIGAWAFAHMKELKRIIVPARKISIGKEAFLDCDKLSEVIIYPGEKCTLGTSYLLASCITILKSYNLLDFEMASEQNMFWCQLYDKELLGYVLKADDRDFQPVIVGWFNDESEEEQLKRYIQNVKLNKIKLSFLRLKFDSCIENNTKETLIAYLRNQLTYPNGSIGTEWKIIRDVLAEDIQYVKLAVKNDLLNEELILMLISYLNDINASTEIVAYLVSVLNVNDKNIDQQFEL